VALSRGVAQVREQATALIVFPMPRKVTINQRGIGLNE
jgi:hypothetical protein